MKHVVCFIAFSKQEVPTSYSVQGYSSAINSVFQKNPHHQKSQGFKSGEREGHTSGKYLDNHDYRQRLHLNLLVAKYEISRQICWKWLMRCRQVWKWYTELVAKSINRIPNYPNQENGTKLWNYCVVIDP
ncbi:hypothetical protein TNCV_2377561 [Trichonephila clavipes]|nr:hypothetical protein TNCV_2377561 [Trichonephila clavipes]